MANKAMDNLSIAAPRPPLRVLLLGIILSAVLTSCGSQPAPDRTRELTLSPAARVQQLLNEATLLTSPQRERRRLQAAKMLITQGHYERAQLIASNMDPEALRLTELASWADILYHYTIHLGDFATALQILNHHRLLEESEQLSERKQINLSLLRAEALGLLGSHMASAQQRIYITALLNEQQRINNQQAIWHSLMQVSIAELSDYRDKSFSQQYRGWLALAIVAKMQQGDLDKQLQQLEHWRQQWPSHPANATLPGGLALLKEIAANRPQHIALMLPLTGKLAELGKAVRDGFIAALYDAQNSGGKVPVLKIYNTESGDDFMQSYQQAVDAGAELIVGPLQKRLVRDLYDQQLPVPTLALNRVEGSGMPPPQLYQFGLAPNDEAQQIAELAYLDNHRNALIISPRGNWGDRISAAFAQRWQSLGGTVVAQSQYSGQKDYSSSLKQSLSLNASEARKSRIAKLIGRRLEFSPRRREDIDMVFLLAQPNQARSINPLLDYHYAGDLPVYGTSHLYAGTLDPNKDRDINGIRFTEMPWILGDNVALRNTMEQAAKHNKQYPRMVAMGIDSFQLYPRLRQLAEIPSSLFFGQSGTLTLNTQRQIERHLALAEIKRSRATIMAGAR